MRKSLVLVLLSSMLPLAGCFHYVPVESTADALERGSTVRARLTEEETVPLRDLTAHSVIALDGEFIERRNSDLMFSALWLESNARQSGFAGEGWTVRIPERKIASLQVRKLDRWRTAATVAGALIGSFLAWEALSGSSGGEGGTSNGGGVAR